MWRKAISSFQEQILVAIPGRPSVSEEVSCLAGHRAPSCFPSLSLPVPTSPWVGAVPSSKPPPPQQSRCIQRHLEAIWQKEKEAIVSLQLESHDLFFLKHLHSCPHLSVATENWGIHVLHLDDGKEPHKISIAAGTERNAGAPFFLKKKVWLRAKKNFNQNGK